MILMNQSKMSMLKVNGGNINAAFEHVSHDFVVFQASQAKLPERKELSVCVIYYY